MARGGLGKWFKDEDWVDIGAPKKNGKFQKCGRKSAKKSKRGYPKCVPRAEAKKMTKKERESAVRRKRAKPQGVGGKPTYVKTKVKKGKEKGDPKLNKFLAKHMRSEYKKDPDMSKDEHNAALAAGYNIYERKSKK